MGKLKEFYHDEICQQQAVRDEYYCEPSIAYPIGYNISIHLLQEPTKEKLNELFLSLSESIIANKLNGNAQISTNTLQAMYGYTKIK